MYDVSCTRDDMIAAYEDLTARLDERRSLLWSAYLAATRDMVNSEKELLEPECWSVLRAGLAGIEAEARMVQRDFELRLASLDAAKVAV